MGADLLEFGSLAFGVVDAVVSRVGLAFDVEFLFVRLFALGMFGVGLLWVWLPCCDIVGLGSSEYWNLLGRFFAAQNGVKLEIYRSIGL